LFANGDNQFDQTKSDGYSPRFLLAYKAVAERDLERPGIEGLPPRRRQRSAQPAAVFGPGRAIFGGYQRFKDESLWNYEVGVKMAQPGLRFNAALFHTQMKDLQVTLDAGSCSSRVVFNVPKAHSTGIELEATWRPSDSWEIGFAGTALNAEFDSTVRDGTGAVLGGIREGNRLPSVPEVQFTASLTYNFKLAGRESYLTASYQHVGSRFTQPSDQENNPRRFVHGLPFLGAPATAATTLDLELPEVQPGEPQLGDGVRARVLGSPVRQQRDRREGAALLRPGTRWVAHDSDSRPTSLAPSASRYASRSRTVQSKTPPRGVAFSFCGVRRFALSFCGCSCQGRRP
jgi:iron complex outermembrane receptor protein